ncbi:MAG: YggT family protein [Alcaligenaceae bacterium]|jgi:YggT family protein|nr:YggT family protein [Alcaligenaceae bacterium]
MTSMLLFLIQIICTLFCAALLLRAWFYFLRIPAFNPLVANVMQLSNWLVLPLKKLFPDTRRIDLASLMGAYIVCAVQLILMLLLVMGMQIKPLLIYIPLEALITLAKNALNLLFWLTLIYALMSWLNPLSPAMTLFGALLEPLLTPIRSLPVLNRMQSIDLSPMVLVILCQFLLIGLRNVSSPIFSLLMV